MHVNALECATLLTNCINLYLIFDSSRFQNYMFVHSEMRLTIICG